MQNEPPCDSNAQEGQGAGMLLRLLQAGMNGRKKFQYSLLKFYEGVMHAEPNVVDSTHIFQQTPIQISRKVHGPFFERFLPHQAPPLIPPRGGSLSKKVNELFSISVYTASLNSFVRG